MNKALAVSHVQKVYDSGRRKVRVLEDVTLELAQGEMAAIVGPSGSGKTTLLSVCAGLEPPTSGTVSLLGHKVHDLPERSLSRLRNRQVGFIFQSFHLMPSLTALENVLLPLELAGGRDENLAAELLDQVGLADRMSHYPAQLSGGEQQRVAIARAFINQPKILFADEPTGNLDRETNARIVDLIFKLNRERGTALLLITHDDRLAAKTGCIHRLEGGRLNNHDLSGEGPVEGKATGTDAYAPLQVSGKRT